MPPLAAYILRRLLWVPLIFLLVTLITFSMTRLVPGDPVTFRSGGRADPETVERIKDDLGLNQPIPVQYGKYMLGFLQGDMGESYASYPGVPVKDLIKERIWITAQLNIAAIILVFSVGILAGAVCAKNVGTWKDTGLISFLLLFQSIPTVIFIPLLLFIFVVELSLLPAAGWHGLFSVHAIIPLIAMTLPGLAGVARLTRVSLFSTMGQDWVRAARARGLAERNVFTHYVLRPALLPLNTAVGGAFIGVFSGSLFVELLYGIPGMGRLALDAVYARDYDIIMAVFNIGALMMLLGLIAVDVLYTVIDPRIRLGADAR